MKRLYYLPILLLMAWPVARAAVLCRVSASGAAFGAYDSLTGQAANTAGTIHVTCAGSVGDSASFTIKISAGGGAAYSGRAMSGGDSSLSYNLYTDAGRSQIWGDGTGNTTYVSDSIVLSAPLVTRAFVVYGRISGGQSECKARNYADNLLITLTY